MLHMKAEARSAVNKSVVLMALNGYSNALVDEKKNHSTDTVKFNVLVHVATADT